MKKKVIISLTALTVFAALFFYFAFWRAFCTWAYLLIFLALAILPIFGYHRLNKLNISNKEDLSKNLLYTLSLALTKTRFQQLLIRIESGLVTMVNSFAWPLAFPYTAKQAAAGNLDYQQMVGSRQKVPQIFVLSYYVLFSGLLTAACYFSVLSSFDLKLLAVTGVTCLNCYLLYFLLTDNIGSAIKQTPLNIYAGILISCACLTICFVLFFLVILSLFRFRHMGQEALDTILHEYFEQQSLIELRKGDFGAIHILTLIINISGLLFAATVLKTIKDYKGFKRDKNDFWAISETFLAAKQFKESAEWQSRVPREEWNNSAWERYIVTTVALDQTGNALKELPRLLYGDDNTAFAADYRFHYIIQRAFSYGIKNEMLLKVYREWVEACKCEGVFVLSLTKISLARRENYFLDEMKGDQALMDDITRHRPTIKVFLDLYGRERTVQEVGNLLEEKLLENKIDHVTSALCHYVLLTYLFHNDKANKWAVNANVIPIYKAVIALDGKNADLVLIWSELKGLSVAVKLLKLEGWDAVIELTEQLSKLVKRGDQAAIVEKIEGLDFS